MLTDQETLDNEGRKLSAKLDYNGLKILQVCEAALTDANFHHEAEIVDQMIKALESVDQPGFTLTVTTSPDDDSDEELDGTIPF